MAKVRLGIIGYGFRGRGLLAMSRTVEGLEPVAVCTSRKETAEKAKAECPDVTCHADYLEMLDSGTVDAVLVETPPQSHAACAIAALERNIHVLSDVPVLHDLEEVQPLWDAAAGSKAAFSFGATTNYWGFVDTCLDLKNKGLLGEPFYLEAEYVQDITEFARATPWRTGYEPIRYCTHSLGPLLKWLGKDQDLAAVACFDTGSHVHSGEAEHDAMAAIFRTASNVVVRLSISFVNCHPHGYHRYVLHGARGYFECTWPLTGAEPDAFFSTKNVYGLDKLTRLPISASRPELATLENVSGHGAADYAMLDDFAKAAKGRPPAIGLREGLRMTLPGLYALESSRRNGELVEIVYPWS